MFDVPYILAGALTGFVVGLTGVGGGALIVTVNVDQQYGDGRNDDAAGIGYPEQSRKQKQPFNLCVCAPRYCL